MQIFDHATAIAGAPNKNFLSPSVRRLLAERVGYWTEAGLLSLTCVIVAERGDTDRDFIDEVGFSPLVNDRQRLGDEGFLPPFDDIVFHENGLVELVACVANDGFAFWVVLDVAEADPQLIAMCHMFAAASDENGGR